MVSRDGGASRDGGPSRPCRWACPHLHVQPGKDAVTGTRSRESRDTQKPTERLWHSCASMRERKPTRHLLWRRSEAGGGPEVSGLLPGTGAAPRGFALRGASRGGEGSEQPAPGAGGCGQVHGPVPTLGQASHCHRGSCRRNSLRRFAGSSSYTW